MIELIYNSSERVVKENSERKIPLYEYIGHVDIRQEVGDFIRGLEAQKINELSMEDIILYDKIPLYIFFRPNFSKWMSNVIEYVIILDRLISKDNITIKTDDKLLKKIADDIFQLECELHENTKDTIKNSRLNFDFQYIVRGLKGIKNYLKFFFKNKFNKKSNMIAFTMAASIAELKHEGGDVEFYDYQYGELLKEIERDYNLFNFQLLHSKEQMKKANKYNNNFIPFEFGIIMKKITDKKLINNELIENNIELVKKIDYTFKGYNLYNIIANYLINYSEKICFSYLKEINYIKRIIKRYNIDKCIVIDEGDRGRCFITAGNVMNKDTYAIQHGIIVKNSHSYHLNSKYENIIPKKTFLWGKRYKNILIDNTNIYNEKNLVAAGQIRTDYMDSLICNKNNNRNNKEKIRLLFISQYMDDLVKPAGRILFEGLSKCNAPYEIIIKVHPGDSIYHKYYENLIKKYKLKNIKIVKDRDLYELLNWSDVVISVHSTVILEAGLLNKPSICIRLPKFDDVCEFVKDGLSIGVKSGEEMLKVLNNREDYFNKEYYLRMKNYMNLSFENVDGNVMRIVKSNILND